MSFADYSTTPASNTSVGGVNIAENCPAGNLNNGLRQIMADLRSAFSTGLATFFAAADSAAARNAILAAGSGANGDITALTGLTSPIAAGGHVQPLRLAQGAAVSGNGTLVTIVSGSFVLPVKCTVDFDVSFNQSYSAPAVDTQSVFRVDATVIGSTGTGPQFLPVTAYGDTLTLAAGTYTVSLLWLGADSSVSINSAKARARAFPAP